MQEMERPYDNNRKLGKTLVFTHYRPLNARYARGPISPQCHGYRLPA
jgi:hypothetical protein